jgi:hypothetical protein
MKAFIEGNCPDAGQHRHPHIAYDANGIPTGHTLAEFSAELDRRLSELYGVDFAKVTQLVDSGELTLDEVTDELLLRPEFECLEAEKTRTFEIPRDENGDPIGYTLEEVFAEVDRNLSEAYGVDFAKVDRLIASGELNEDEITNELLLRPEFKYEPYPGFKPKPLPPDFKPDPEWLAALDFEEDA